MSVVPEKDIPFLSCKGKESYKYVDTIQMELAIEIIFKKQTQLVY